jgi:WD40 repeat protein
MAEGPSDPVEALFARAADLSAEEQQALLEAACANDPLLRVRVEKLLAADARLRADEDAQSILTSPLERSAPSPASAAPAGRPPLPARIGHYVVRSLLGEGGMAVVYEAEQDSPRRTVALKVIRPGLLSPALLRRFAAEAQILGRLHHPGIAQIYEAGLAEDGQPFFALELIRGVPLDEHVRRQNLTVPARVELLARVCDAVQHAHEQGIIHRDLKPGNILVDETGQPRVLDFGVARATGLDLQTSIDRTRTGQLIGTLNYMSPEQVAADSAGLDARSDVYTLGVILFELLAGRGPYVLDHLSLPEAAQMIREAEPARLGSIDVHFRGDLETITAKALEKDRARRYGSAAELAADLRRHLHQEPIRARPPSAMYQLGKFVRRHKALVGGTVGVVAALVVGLIGTLLFAVRAEHNAAVAQQEKHATLVQAYRARIAAATASLVVHDVADAARQLDEAPEELRDWEWHHLHGRLDDSSTVLPPPMEGPRVLLSGPGGLRIGSVTADGLHVTDKDGRESLIPCGPGRTILAAGQMPGGVWLADQGPDGSLHLLDEAGKVRLSLPAAAGARKSYRLAVQPDLSRLVIDWLKGWPPEFEVYDTATGKRMATCGGHADHANQLAFSPDGSRIASASEDRTARLWDAATGAPVAVLRGHARKLYSVAFRPDGARLLTTSADETVRQWDARTGAAVEPPYEKHVGEVRVAVYSPDGRWIASGGTDRTVRVWWATGRQEVALLHGHRHPVTDLAFAGDHRLASVDRDGVVRIWDVGPEASLPVLRGHTDFVYPVAFSPDGEWIASGSWDRTAALWNAATGERSATLRHLGVVRALAFSPDSSWLVSAGDGEDRLHVWDLATGRRRKTIAVRLPGPRKNIEGLAVRPDGARIAATDREGNLFVLDAETGREIAVEHLGLVRVKHAVAYSPDGRWLAGSGGDLQVYLWDAHTHRLAKRLAGHRGEITSIAFSRDGRRLVSASIDGTVRVWDVATGECRAELTGHTDEVFAAVFHPEGRRIASAGRDGLIWLWDAVTGQETARLPGHTSYVFSLAFSPDGATLVSGSGDGTLRLWDTAPLRVRHEARRAAEALRPRADRLVEKLLEEKKDPDAVVAALRADESLDAPLRRVALQVLLRRLTAAEASPEPER